MNVDTGETYKSRQDALDKGVPDERLVEVRGHPKAVKRLKQRVRLAAQYVEEKRKSRRKAAKKSRAKNRRQR